MRLTFAQLEALLDELNDRLFKAELSLNEYISEWDKLMVFAGWTWPEFVVEVDRHWAPEKKVRCTLFQC